MEEPKVAGEAPAGGPSQQTADFGEELKRLGQQLGEAAKAAWESESSRKAQAQVRDGLGEMVKQLEDAARKIQASEETQKLRAQAGRVVESARKSDIAGEMRQGLLTVMRELNEELARATERLREEKPAEKGEDKPAQ